MSSCATSCADPRRTWIEHWPAALAVLSFRSEPVALDAAELHALGRANGVGIGVFEPQPPAVLARLQARLDAALQRLGGPAFVRLGSRSPKDTEAFVLGAGQARSGAQVLQLLGAGSVRIGHDLRLCLRSGWLPSIFLREWSDIAPGEEWRGFLAGGRVLACRQRGGAEAAPPEALALGVQVAAAWGHDPVVFDAWCPAGTRRARLIEINPWGPPTDALGLDWAALQAACVA